MIDIFRYVYRTISNTVGTVLLVRKVRVVPKEVRVDHY